MYFPFTVGITYEARLEKPDDREKWRLSFDLFEFHTKTMKLKIELKNFRLIILASLYRTTQQLTSSNFQ